MPRKFFVMLIIFLFASLSWASEKIKAGDIVLADGSITPPENFKALEKNNFPVAIIAGKNPDGEIFGVGVHRSSEPLAWTLDEGKTFPAFEFVKSYAEKNNLKISGWHMPEISELLIIYENREAINKSLGKIYALNKNASMNTLGNNWYWLATESKTRENYAWFVHFFNGYSAECPKDFTNLHVIAVRNF